MNKKKIDVSVIYVNYNTSHLLEESLKSFKQFSDGFSYEIIVVDNSCNETENLLLEKVSKEYSTTNIYLDNNSGFGCGNNEGAKKANGKYLYFVNCDTIFVSNACFELLYFISNNPNCGIVGSNLLSKDGSPNYSFSLEEKNLKNEKTNDRLLKSKKNGLHFNNGESPLKINGFVSGASFMISKECFDKLGGFPKEIYLYAEESYLCYQLIHKLGLDIYNVPSSRLIHLEGKSFGADETRIKHACNGNYTYYELLFGKDVAKQYLKHKIKIYNRNAVLCFVAFKFSKSKKFCIFSRVYKKKLIDVQG